MDLAPERNDYDEQPVPVEYPLTEKGRDLGGVLEAIAGWAAVWRPQIRQRRLLLGTVEVSEKCLLCT